MRYKRRHTRNGVQHAPGDPFTGPINAGRFLFGRGVLETDGHPDDDAITRNPGRARQQWGYEDTPPPEPAPAPATAPSLDEINLTFPEDKE